MTPSPEPQPSISFDPIHERCPHCTETHPRDRIDRHVSSSHGDLPACTAALKQEGQEPFVCSFRVGHDGGERGSWHASAYTPTYGRLVWNDTAVDATSHTTEPASVAAPVQNSVLEKRLRLAHQARRAKEHQLDDIRRALCDVGFMNDDDPYGHADLADVIRQVGEALREKPTGVREQQERPAHPDGTPYRYHEIVAEGWGFCVGCHMWSTATVDRPHTCTGPNNVMPSNPEEGA